MTSELHRATDRGTAEHGWLQSRFSFSFAQYHNPQKMGFGALRVLNDDRIAPSGGFDMHPHRDMEIVTIVTEGCVEHHDSMGHHGTTCAWEVQCMSAGNGIMHSEFNPSSSQPLTLFQIWIYPHTKGLTPAYNQKRFTPDLFEGRFTALASGLDAPGALKIHQNAQIERGKFNAAERITLSPKAPLLYLFVISGELRYEQTHLFERDALGLKGPHPFTFETLTECDLLLFHLPHYP